MSEIPVVNENDEIIGYKKRDDRNNEDIIRISGLWIENEKGAILIARRAVHKTRDPGKWGPAAAGTVEKGETYQGNIIKEAHEEIGLVVSEDDIIHVGTFLEKTEHRYFVGVFYTSLPSDTVFTLEPDEVAEVKWITWSDLEKEIEDNPQDFLLSLQKGIMQHVKQWKEMGAV